jgi:hypothetical protein
VFAPFGCVLAGLGAIWPNGLDVWRHHVFFA